MTKFQEAEARWNRVTEEALAKRKAMFLAGVSFELVQAEWKRTIPAELDLWLSALAEENPWMAPALTWRPDDPD